MEKRGAWIIGAVALFTVTMILRVVGPMQKYLTWTTFIERLLEVLMLLIAAAILIKAVSVFVHSKGMRSVLIFLVIICTLLLGASIFQGAILMALAKAGIVAAVIIFIFQTPLLNIVAWIYLATSQIYRPGDRIRVTEYKGDVVNITPMHTRIREIGGDYLHSDHHSGRMVTFPNSMVLTSPVSNYTKHFPFIWVDLNFQLTYPTDLNWTTKTIKAIVQKHLKPYEKNLKKNFKEYVKEFELPEDTSAIEFYIEPEGSWIEMRVAFPVPPKMQAEVKSEIAYEIIKKFKKNPKKAGFPKGTNR
jgi:small-conductance mechanosensitive channel